MNHPSGTRNGPDLTRRRAILGLGSNLGDREDTIARALRALSACSGVKLLAASPLDESPPAVGPPQGDYLNGAALVETSLAPSELLAAALGIERSLGRVRPDPVRWGPRTIDIDVLWIEGLAVRERDLVVPHPRLGERAFALRPLLDLAPDAADPRSGERYAALPAAALPLRKHADPPAIGAA